MPVGINTPISVLSAVLVLRMGMGGRGEGLGEGGGKGGWGGGVGGLQAHRYTHTHTHVPNTRVTFNCCTQSCCCAHVLPLLPLALCLLGAASLLMCYLPRWWIWWGWWPRWWRGRPARWA